MKLTTWIAAPLLVTVLAGCSNKKKEEGPPPPPPTVPHDSINGPWGAVSNGLSLHVNLAKATYAPGEPIVVRLAVGNFGSSNQTFPAVISEPSTRMREDLLLLQSKVSDPPSSAIGPGQAYATTLPPLRLAPGTYRLRVILDGAERPADQAPAWHGRLVSTDLTVTVTAPL